MLINEVIFLLATFIGNGVDLIKGSGTSLFFVASRPNLHRLAAQCPSTETVRIK